MISIKGNILTIKVHWGVGWAKVLSAPLYALLILSMHGDDNPNPLTPLQPRAVDKDSLLVSSANLR